MSKIPGMKIATVAASPVFDGKLARLDDSKAKAVKGVRPVVRLDNAVAGRLAAGLDEQGMPIAWNHRVAGSSILARWAPPAFKNGLDSDAVEGAAGPYAFPNLLIDYVR